MTQNLVNRGARKAANVDAAFAKSATEGKKSTTKKSKKNKVVPGYVQFLRDYYAALASAFLMYTYLMYVFMKDGNYRGFMELSYKSKDTGRYFHGFEDWKMVVTLINVLMVCRWICQELVFAPIALFVKPRMKPSQLYKYKDMGFQLVWYSVSWVASVYYLYILTDRKLDLDMMWKGQNYPTESENPHISSIFGFKLFYLFELSFWLQMILITMIEEKRKDFHVMMAHHFLTSGLIGVSYFQNFALAGCALLAEQDFADIFLPLAKLAKYSGMDGIADIVFAFFAVAWIPTRHGIFFYLFYQYNRGKIFITSDNPYNPSIGAYLSVDTINYFLIVLGLFQCLLCIWLKDIIIAVHKALTSSENLEDHRSDSDE